MAKRIKFSIVVAVFNQLQYTELFLKSLREHSDREYELIVIDNGSTDSSRSFLKQQNIDKLICWDKNAGVTVAWNRGIEAANGEYICVINNDVLVAPAWLSGLEKALRDAPADTATISPSTNGVTYQLTINEKNAEAFYSKAKELQAEQPASLWHFSLIGSCIVLPRKTIETIGLFDERYFIYYNDLDYHLRAVTNQMVTRTTSLSTIYHFGSKSANAVTDRHKELDKKKFLDKWRMSREFLNQYFAALD